MKFTMRSTSRLRRGVVPVLVAGSTLAALLTGCGGRTDEDVSAAPGADTPAASVPGPAAAPEAAAPEAGAVGGAASAEVPAPATAAAPPVGAAPVATTPAPARAAAPRPAAAPRSGSPAPAGTQPASPAPAQAAPAPSSAAAPAPSGASAAPVAPKPQSPTEKVYDSGASDDTIRVGAICSLTGLLDTYRCQGAAAYFQRLNDQGGVNGRKVKLILVDDQFDPSKHAALARRLFEQEGVFAMVSSQAPLSIHGAAQYVRDKKLPIVGGDMSDVGDTWGVNPFFVPQSYIEGQSGGAIAATYALQNESCTKIGGLAWNAPQATNWTDAWRRTLKENGRDFDYYAATSLAETQFNSYISEMKSKGIDCVTLGMSGSSLVQFSKQAFQQGFTAKRFYPMPPYDPAYISATGPAGVGTFSLLAHTPFEAKTPAVQQFFTDMKTYQPRTVPNSYAMLAYASADLFREAVARMGNNLTRASLLATLEAFQNYDGGFVPPITIGPGPKLGGRCGNMVQLQEDGTWAIRRPNLCV